MGGRRFRAGLREGARGEGVGNAREGSQGKGRARPSKRVRLPSRVGDGRDKATRCVARCDARGDSVGRRLAVELLVGKVDEEEAATVGEEGDAAVLVHQASRLWSERVSRAQSVSVGAKRRRGRGEQEHGR